MEGGEEYGTRNIGIVPRQQPQQQWQPHQTHPAQGGQAAQWAPVNTGAGYSQYTPNPSQFPQAQIFVPTGGGQVIAPPSRPSSLYAKPQTLRLEDTNCALIGSDADKQQRFNASNAEQAWTEAGRAPGIQVWRIEQFHVVAWPREKFGTFMDGDSYIILATYDKGNGQLGWDLHFWLGMNTPIDAAGTAAYKTVELDDHLHCAAVQHRQVQGHEDDVFLAYWKPAMHVMSGGAASGFHHWTAPVYPKKLYVVEGTRGQNVRVSEIQLHCNSLNAGDVYILDSGRAVWQFNGSQSNVFERTKALEFVQKLVNERDSNVQQQVVEQGDSQQGQFMAELGADPSFQVPPAIPKPPLTRGVTELKVAQGQAPFQIIASGFAANRSVFQSDLVLVVDSDDEQDGIFVWVGRNAQQNWARAALQIGLEYLRYYRKPQWMPLHRVIEGNESQQFYSLWR